MQHRPTARTLAIAILLVLVSLETGAQEKLDFQMLDRIRNEGLVNSKITEIGRAHV